MVNSVPVDRYPMDDATMKTLILDTACKCEAIARCLDNHVHPAPHGNKLVPYGDTMSEMKKVKGETPYKSAYKAVAGEGTASNTDETYLRMFTRNLITPA